MFILCLRHCLTREYKYLTYFQNVATFKTFKFCPIIKGQWLVSPTHSGNYETFSAKNCLLLVTSFLSRNLDEGPVDKTIKMSFHIPSLVKIVHMNLKLLWQINFWEKFHFSTNHLTERTSCHIRSQI